MPNPLDPTRELDLQLPLPPKDADAPLRDPDHHQDHDHDPEVSRRTLSNTQKRMTRQRSRKV